MIVMMERKIAQIHLWPWSVYVPEETCDLKHGALSFPYFGSPLFSVSNNTSAYLSSRYEKFLKLGPVYIGPSGPYQLLELPHAMLSGKGSVSIFISEGQHRFHCEVDSDGARSRYEETEGSDRPTETALARVVVSWSQFFDDLMEKASYISDSGKRLAWQNIVDYIRQLSEEQKEPPKALILEIAERMHKKLPEVVRGLRKVLVRERSLEHVGRIEELDNSCVYWLARKPGRSVPQKAGSKQKVLAVRRVETFDLHENRIVKDFLERCSSECIRYIESEIAENQVYKESSRFQIATSFRSLCSRLHRERVFDVVSRPIPGTAPNYVLLSDLRYREVWKWYVKLLRREEEEDRSWDWQTRTWADIVRLLVNSSISGLLVIEKKTNTFGGNGITVQPVLSSLLSIRKRQQLGVRTDAGSEPGPFDVTFWKEGKPISKMVLEIVHPDHGEDHSIVKSLGQLGAHLYLVAQSPSNADDSVIVIAVWAVHTAGSKRAVDLQDIGKSAFRGLERHRVIINAFRFNKRIELYGIVLNNKLESTQTAVFTGNSTAIPVINIPASPKYWYDTLIEIGVLLEDIFMRLLK